MFKHSHCTSEARVGLSEVHYVQKLLFWTSSATAIRVSVQCWQKSYSKWLILQTSSIVSVHLISDGLPKSSYIRSHLGKRCKPHDSGVQPFLLSGYLGEKRVAKRRTSGPQTREHINITTQGAPKKWLSETAGTLFLVDHPDMQLFQVNQVFLVYR